VQKKREKRAEASGALAAVAARVREHEAELGQANLRHAEVEHRTLTIQCKVPTICLWRCLCDAIQTTEMANKDLEKYYHALDKYGIILSCALCGLRGAQFGSWL